MTDFVTIHPNDEISENPIRFLGSGWALGNQDKRSLELWQIYTDEIKLVSFPAQIEHSPTTAQPYIDYTNDTKWIRLDARFFTTLWENQSFIPARFKDRVDGEYPIITFDGSEVWGPQGFMCTLCLTWNGKLWNMGYKWHDYTWNRPCLSAVIPV